MAETGRDAIEWSIPEDVPEDRCGFTVEYPASSAQLGNVTCWRKPWKGHGRCIWHADARGKTTRDLVVIEGDPPERLDGAVLREAELGDSISFTGCVLRGADLREIDLQDAELREADLKGATLSGSILGDAKFTEANLEHADLKNADIPRAEFSFANLSRADLRRANLDKASLEGINLTGADLRVADFAYAILKGANLTETALRNANFTHANLSAADLTNADLRGADLSEARLKKAVLVNANLSVGTPDGIVNDAKSDYLEWGFIETKNVNLSHANLDFADLTDADLESANLTEATARAANLSNTNLEATTLTRANFGKALLVEANLESSDLTEVSFHGAVLTRSNLRNTELSSVNLRGCNLKGVAVDYARLDDIEIDEGTRFGDRSRWEADADAKSKQAIPYLPWRFGPFRTFGRPFTDPDDLEQAELQYRATQRVLRENDLRELPELAVREKHARRKRALAERDYWTWIKLAFYRWPLGYGERVRNVIGTSAVTIVGFGAVYPFVGGMEASSQPTTPYAFGNLLPLPSWLPEGAEILGANLYFSAVTFTTLGYGDIQPATPAAQFLASVESLIGALLMAFLVFVLGRRTTW